MRYAEFAGPSLLQDAFNTYRRNNITRSQRAFSHRILGQAPSYYSCMVNRNRQPSRTVLETLLNVTKTLLASFIGNPHFGKSYAKNLNQAHAELEVLAETISAELELKQLMDEI